MTSSSSQKSQEILDDLQKVSTDIGLKIHKDKSKLMTNTKESMHIALENIPLNQGCQTARDELFCHTFLKILM